MTKFKFKKKFGQNFLIDSNTIEDIVNSISPNENDLIIEIGPGAGAITSKLKKYNANILAFEIDKDTSKFLKILEDNKTKIIYADFLESDVTNVIKDIEYNNLYIIGNLPYYITTPIIEKIIEENLKEESLTIMVQKEVAERFLAKPKSKEYGYMTVLLNYHYNIEKVCEVPRIYFEPSPNVDSTVIKLIKKDKAQIDYEKFKKFLKDCFQFKRKTLNNNLIDYDKDIIEKILIQNGYSLSNRAEEIDLDTFITIVKQF